MLNGSEVIVLTNKQHGHKQTLLKAVPSRYAITLWVVIGIPACQTGH